MKTLFKRLLPLLLSLALTCSFTVSATGADTLSVTIRHSTALKLFDRDGAEIVPTSSGEGASTYQLLRGESYRYESTDGCYTASAEFVASEESVLAVEPIREDWLTALYAANGTNSEALKKPYPQTPAFSPVQHSYRFEVSDLNTRFGLFVQAVPKVSLSVSYRVLSNGQEKSLALTSGVATNLPYFVQLTGACSHAVLRAVQERGGVTYSQEYTLQVCRVLHLRSLEASLTDTPLKLSPAFDRDRTDYRLQLPQQAQALSLTLQFPQSFDNAYFADLTLGTHTQRLSLADGEQITTTLPLDADAQTLTIRVWHSDTAALETTYRLTLDRLPPVHFILRTTPSEAVVFLQETQSGKRVLPDEVGTYTLMQGGEYTYHATLPGYCAQQGSLTASADGVLELTLEKAPMNPSLPTSLPAQWANFRGNADNNGVTSAPTPTAETGAVLYWASRPGQAQSSEALSSPILVGGYLYAYAGDRIYKIDRFTGKTLAEGRMARSSGYAINNPAYADGMLFVGLSDGGVQAFNAETLKSLWLYNDPLAGQPDCPIVCHKGYVYTGFWKSETEEASFVCLTATDENPAEATEEKQASWSYRVKGGFYWAGACVRDDFLLVGTDDGESGYNTGHAALLSLDSKNGRLLDCLRMPGVGDLRSSVAYDKATDAYYVTSKGGDFYQVRVDENGRFLSDSLRRLSLGNMSTSTPVIHNGRAYVGVCGSGQFVPYFGHHIAVIDLAAWSIAYRVPTQGYPQTSGLLTTAYDGGVGTVYVYFLDNYTPGKLRILQDKPGQKAASLLTVESYSDGKGEEQTVQTAHVLFTPDGRQAEYAICSPIADAEGTLYFKNDSGYLMALGSEIAALEVTSAPNRTEYWAGERFDPAGLRVEAVFTNGLRRDVTSQLSYSDAPLSKELAEDFELRFTGTLYHDRDSKAGVAYSAPSTFLKLQIIEESLQFSDVQKQNWFYDAVCYAYRNGLFRGVSDTSFAPNAAMTRGMLVTVLYRMEGSPAASGTPFADIKPTQYYADAVAWATENGIVNGMSATHFAPEEPITREQMAAILYRYAGFQGFNQSVSGSLSAFPDEADVLGYARTPILWAVERGLIKGSRRDGRDYLLPQSGATRAEVATILMRYRLS